MAFPREILLLRHGKSSWDAGVESDFSRPLAPRGKRDAPRMGAWVLGQALVPDEIVSSPAKRAKQTAKRVADAMGFDPGDIRYDERIYGAESEDLRAVLSECAGPRVLMIGHNPGFEELVDELAGGAPVPKHGKLFPTCALAYFRKGDLVTIVRPRDLGD